MVGDGQVYRVPANVTVMVLAPTCDAVANASDTTQSLSVDVQ